MSECIPVTTEGEIPTAKGEYSSALRRVFNSALCRRASLALALCFAGALMLRASFQSVVVSGDSMVPTLRNGDRVVASSAYWLVGPIRQGDIVVIRGALRGEYMIKRVHRLAGQVVDWQNVPDSWLLTRGEYRVPSGCIYVLGDNSEISEDSRKYGPIPMDRVLGKVVRATTGQPQR